MSNTRRPIPVLMYHQVAQPAPRGTSFRSLTVHPASFAKQMVWMSRLGYQGLSMQDLLPYLSGERTGKVFGITFDDGYRNVLHNALPVLKKLGFTSTNYFVANQFGGTNSWDHAKNVPAADLMTAEEVRTWAESGQEVGSHTLDHVHLTEVSDEQALYQITESKRVLEQTIDRTVTAFCYPYGDYRPEHARMALAAGYTNATTTERGLAHAEDNRFELSRVGIWRQTHLIRFFQKCLTQHEDRRGG